MKKLFGISVLALAVALAAQQEASAWTNIRFGIGANMAWQTGNNSAIWGLWRDGQIPGAPTDTGGAFGGKHGQGGFGGPGFGGPGYGFPPYGGAPNLPPGTAGVGGDGAAPTPEPPPTPPGANPKTDAGSDLVGYFYGNGVRRAVYSTPSYYQPEYSYYYYVPQSYYGR